MIRIADKIPTCDDLAIFVLRLAIGAVFFAHGAQKLLGWFYGAGLAKTIEAFHSHLGIPSYLTILVVLIEFFGGIFLIMGLLSRLCALGFSIIMVFAILLVHLQHGFFINWFNMPGKGHGIEYNLVLMGGCLAIMLTGAKSISLDDFLYRRFLKDGNDQEN
ncbi:DoxX family protein [Elusimicrobiota bacterium]